MADDWIKIRADIYRDPKVILMADLLMDRDGDLAKSVNMANHCDMSVTRNVTRNVMRNAVVGALVSVWGVSRHRGERADDDLFIPGLTVSMLDHIADLPGFGEAMEQVGWVLQNDQGLVFPRYFAKYNADPKESQREANRERQQRYRERHRNALRNGDSNVTRNVTRNVKSNAREEKRREEKKREKKEYIHSATDRFAEFWEAFPRGRRKSKGPAQKAWLAALKITDADTLIRKAAEYAESEEGRGEYVKMPSTWLNQRCWEDDPAAWNREGAVKQERRKQLFSQEF